ncbi:class I SAM-dependent methyltransferase [Nocardioides sp. CFH 31398]|uniref:class I SAM-dependent methyltransferase n=1 Tax=Nocardioides sp. CFH 31398 TaxID=2919579 RepID=UPI001F06DEE4|nr:class I SAM-dependent methyltransferase [Nocardioides sp. CFH 31398]MCH1866151.1 methyltransferase domain-containing protein [Nocardioides sp. CFH 31398]
MRLPVVGQVLGGWETDPLWATVYEASVNHPAFGAPFWRVGFGSDQRLLHETVGSLSSLPAGSRVLDVPCGGGIALRGLRPDQGLDYVAADISPAMLERARRAAERLGVTDQVTFRETDVADLPDDDASYDRVLSLTGIHCFPEPREAVVEMTRVLRPGGELVGSAFLTDTGWRYEAGRRVGRASGILGPMCSRSELHGWLRAGGMRRVTVRTSGALVYFRATKG